jgi:hypothetical protein
MSTVSLDIVSNLDRAAKAIGDLSAKQIPFGVAQALTRTAASLARDELPAQMRTRLSQGGPPTAFTLRAFQYQRAEKASLVAVVYAARAQDRYLNVLTTGGTRGLKRFERKYSSLAQELKQALVPTGRLKKNASGNVSLATIRRIGETVAKDKSGRYFIGKPRGGNRPIGVYERVSRGKVRRLIPLFVEAGRPRYTRLLPLKAITEQHVATVFQGELDKALAIAMATAR